MLNGRIPASLGGLSVPLPPDKRLAWARYCELRGEKPEEAIEAAITELLERARLWPPKEEEDPNP